METIDFAMGLIFIIYATRTLIKELI